MMKNHAVNKRVLRVGALLLGLSLTLLLSNRLPSTSGQIDLTGLWAFRASDGRTDFFSLKQKGDVVEGIDIGFLKLPLNGSFQRGDLHLAGSFVHRGQSHMVQYDVVVTSAGTTMVERRPVTINGGPELVIKGKLERATQDEITPPALPLPVLRDLPDNGLTRTPPMGWNSWNHFHTAIDDATIRATADAMVSSGMSKVGYKYILIDGSWSGSRDANGNLVGNARFPDMKALADYVHSKGLKIGLYSSPGPRSCGGYPASYGHEEQDAKTFARWGYDYLKYDWCSAGLIYRPEDIRAVYQKMGQALLNSGRPIVYSLCEYGKEDVWTWGADAGGNLWRTTGDITDTWSSMESDGFNQVEINGYNKPGHWNDPDNLEVGNGGMTGNEYRTQMSLWALLRAPLIAGNDLRNMTEDTRSILMNSEVIAIDQDPSVKPVEKIAQYEKIEVLARRLSDGSLALGMFNRGDQSAEVSVSRTSLHLDSARAAKGFQIRDLWAHRLRDMMGTEYKDDVPAHGVVLLRISVVP